MFGGGKHVFVQTAHGHLVRGTLFRWRCLDLFLFRWELRRQTVLSNLLLQLLGTRSNWGTSNVEPEREQRLSPFHSVITDGELCFAEGESYPRGLGKASSRFIEGWFDPPFTSRNNVQASQ